MTRTYADERARELLAAECEGLGANATAHSLLRGAATDYFVATVAALRAIEKALALSTPQPDSDLVEKVARGWTVCPDCQGESPNLPMRLPGCQTCGNEGGWESEDALSAIPRTYADGIEDALTAIRRAYLSHDPTDKPDPDCGVCTYLRKAETAIRTLSTSPGGIEDAREALTGWRLIEDGAPKDGTEILLWGRCERDGQFFARDCNVGWYDDGSVGDEGWTARDLPIEPTHWMPLPAPPLCESASNKIGGDHG